MIWIFGGGQNVFLDTAVLPACSTTCLFLRNMSINQQTCFQALTSGRCPHRERASAKRVGIMSASAVGPCCPGRRPRYTERRPRCSERRSCRQPLPTHIPCATPDLLLKHLDATIATTKEDIWNTWNKHLKHLRKRLKTFKNHYKHMQHLDETLVNICMKHLKTLETYICTMHVYATSR
jgi:hypothetical protein